MQRSLITKLSLLLFVGLLTWGLYTLVVYFGIPVHGKVLLSESGWNVVANACSPENYLCRGLAGFIPAVHYTIVRLAPFLAYAFFGTLAYLGFLGWRALKGYHFSFDVEMKPWHVYAIFVASLWLLFSTLSSGTYNDVAMRRVIEPHPSLYTGDNPEALQELQNNFNSLLDGGCLRKTRQINQNASEYQMKMFCMQKHFVTRVLSQLMFLSLLTLVCLVAGRGLFSLCKFSQPKQYGLLVESVLSVGAGVCIVIAFLWLLSIVGILTGSIAWAAIAATLLGGYKQTRYWLRAFLTHRFEVSRPWYSLTILCAALLISYLAFNFLTVIRPFPIGWDDLGSYLNRPRLLVSYGEFIHKMSSFQWEFMSAIGYLLYGYNSIFGSTAAMVINWSAGLFAVVTILAFCRIFAGKGTGIIAAFLYYTLPIIGHFSFADMKTDNALFALQTLAMLCLFMFLFKAEGEDETPNRSVWFLVLSGVFCAFAFGTKATAIMVLMTLLAVTAGVMLHWVAFVGVALLSFIVFELQGPFSFAEVLERTGSTFFSPNIAMAIVAILGLGCFAYAGVRSTKNIRKAVVACFAIAFGFGLGIAPWIVHNNVLAGNIIPRPILTAPDTLSPLFDYSGTKAQDSKRVVHSLPEELALDPTHPACVSTAVEEELGRYWGFREGWTHYLTLPWRSVMNIDSAGYYVTAAPALLLFPLLLLLPFFWQEKGKWLRWLFAGTVFLLIQWIFLANGVPWYGIGVFLGLVVGLELLFQRAPDKQNRFLVVILLGASILSCFAMRSWQFDQQVNLLEYPMGKASAGVMRERTIPHYDDITDMILDRHKTMSDRPYLYRVGTFIPYFIPKNLEIIGVADHQLDTFNCLYQERDNALTLKRLQALGYNSIIFDTNTATIERDENGSLHKKVESFVNFLNDSSLGIVVSVNDPARGVVYLLLP